MKLLLIFALLISSQGFAQEKSKEQTPSKVAPVKPIAPVKPVAPVKEVEPVAPVAPVEPVSEQTATAPASAPKNRLSKEGWQWRASVGLDFQLAESNIVPQGSYSDPDGDVKTGGAVGIFARRYITPHFAMTTGGELVSRQLEQEYDWWFVSNGGETRYDIVSFEVPLYFELILGQEGKHVLYMGPKLATPLYDHCNDDIDDPASAYPCVKDAASSLFIPLQFGYHLRLGNGLFGLTIFMERTLTKIIDKQDLEVDAFRTGVHASFYF